MTSGTVINPLIHQGQIEGGIVQGQGYALTEELKLDDGHITTVTLGDYKLPNIADNVPSPHRSFKPKQAPVLSVPSPLPKRGSASWRRRWPTRFTTRRG